jgi:glycosyltransferase involved in cell wall biosynthesis
VYWSKFPAPWFVDRCNAVAARGNVELEVWFDVRHPDKWDWDVDESEWAFRARYVPTRRLAGWANRLPLPELRERPPDLFVSDYDNAHIVLGFSAARAIAGRTAFRVLPTFDAWSERTWWRELGKHVVFRAVDGAKVGGLDGAQLAGRYGLPAERTWDVTQSIDLARYSAGANTRADERETARREQGLSGVVLIYVGRLWDGKGVGHLLDAYTELRRGGKDVSLLLVGNGPDEPRYRARARDVPGVVFTGWQQRDRTPWYYSLADVLVFPTLGDPNGLVVTEALAAGLPVVSSDAAGNIHRRLPPGGPGLVVPAGDVPALTDALRTLVDDGDLRRSMSAQAPAHVQGMGADSYAADFDHFVDGVLAAPRRRTPAAAALRAVGRLVARRGAAMGDPAPYVEASPAAEARRHAEGVGPGSAHGPERRP